MSSHKTDCLSVAVVHVEGEQAEGGRYPAPAEVDRLAHEALSAGDVSCICAELPS